MDICVVNAFIMAFIMMFIVIRIVTIVTTPIAVCDRKYDSVVSVLGYCRFPFVV